MMSPQVTREGETSQRERSARTEDESEVARAREGTESFSSFKEYHRRMTHQKVVTAGLAIPDVIDHQQVLSEVLNVGHLAVWMTMTQFPGILEVIHNHNNNILAVGMEVMEKW